MPKLFRLLLISCFVFFGFALVSALITDTASAAFPTECIGKTCGYRTSDGHYCGYPEYSKCSFGGYSCTCPSGKHCSGGRCVEDNPPPTCQNQCSAGTKRCYNGSSQACGDYNRDGCTNEWQGVYCLNGCNTTTKECINSCTPNCTNKQCGSNGCGGSCGTCSNVPNASASCSTQQQCTYTCNAGYANCDNNWGNGCEVNTNTDTNNCGRCGNKCGTGSTCENGTCKEPEKKCADTDKDDSDPTKWMVNGDYYINQYKKGTTTSKIANDTCASLPGAASCTDYCANSNNSVVEFYCNEDGSSGRQIIDCPYGCDENNGSCFPKKNCRDTDRDPKDPNKYKTSDGSYYLNPYIKGTITVGNYGGGAMDTCSNDKKQVFEYYCKSDGNYGTKYIDCPIGYLCEDGACVEQDKKCPNIEGKVCFNYQPKNGFSSQMADKTNEIYLDSPEIAVNIKSSISTKQCHVSTPLGNTYFSKSFSKTLKINSPGKISVSCSKSDCEPDSNFKANVCIKKDTDIPEESSGMSNDSETGCETIYPYEVLTANWKNIMSNKSGNIDKGLAYYLLYNSLNGNKPLTWADMKTLEGAGIAEHRVMGIEQEYACFNGMKRKSRDVYAYRVNLPDNDHYLLYVQADKYNEYGPPNSGFNFVETKPVAPGCYVPQKESHDTRWYLVGVFPNEVLTSAAAQNTKQDLSDIELNTIQMELILHLIPFGEGADELCQRKWAMGSLHILRDAAFLGSFLSAEAKALSGINKIQQAQQKMQMGLGIGARYMDSVFTIGGGVVSMEKVCKDPYGTDFGDIAIIAIALGQGKYEIAKVVKTPKGYVCGATAEVCGRLPKNAIKTLFVKTGSINFTDRTNIEVFSLMSKADLDHFANKYGFKDKGSGVYEKTFEVGKITRKKNFFLRVDGDNVPNHISGKEVAGFSVGSDPVISTGCKDSDIFFKNAENDIKNNIKPKITYRNKADEILKRRLQIPTSAESLKSLGNECGYNIVKGDKEGWSVRRFNDGVEITVIPQHNTIKLGTAKGIVERMAEGTPRSNGSSLKMPSSWLMAVANYFSDKITSWTNVLKAAIIR